MSSQQGVEHSPYVRAFACHRCGQMLFVENHTCLRCGSAVGLDARVLDVVLLDTDVLQRCSGFGAVTCPWLVPTATGGRCPSCALVRRTPVDLSGDQGEQLATTLAALRRLVFQLLSLGLPTTLASGPLVLDLPSGSEEPVTIGHADGVITLDVGEADVVHREEVRVQLAEPYRTVLGHPRHEYGHAVWDTLVVDDDGSLARCRELFGDDTLDYAAELDRHYAQGPPPDWQERHVSAYATMHPYEDWAETFAHYLHLRAVLQTAEAYGVLVTGPTTPAPLADAEALEAAPHEHVDDEPFEDVLGTWLPLVYALNGLQRSMGQPDLYPFVLAPGVVEKLAFVHGRVAARRG